MPGVETVTPADGGLVLRLTVQHDVSAVLKVAARHDAISLNAREPSLEEVFLRFYAPAEASPAQHAAGDR